ncbi:hypothetical protein [Afipia clevelandensis]|uniref:hypothetical protein n=1 Tax=Afipia clevelandensis TaxID=1034 RepID=UPI0012F6DCA5|nr:hypothetical protein [Afipia clevelandensis]
MMTSCLAAQARRMMAEVHERLWLSADFPLPVSACFCTFAIKTREQGADVTWPESFFDAVQRAVPAIRQEGCLNSPASRANAPCARRGRGENVLSLAGTE